MAENIIDLEQTIERFNGDEAIAKKLLEMFVEQLPEYRENIQTTFANTNYDKLYDAAHSLKGSLCYVIIPKLSTTVLALETAAKKKNQKKIPAIIEKLEDQMAAIEKEYQAEFSVK